MFINFSIILEIDDNTDFVLEFLISFLFSIPSRPCAQGRSLVHRSHDGILKKLRKKSTRKAEIT